MSLDRDKVLASAERHLKQGRVEAAIEEIEPLARDGHRDLSLQNRIGDLLARHRQGERAIVYYQRIAEEFSRNGFYPKAIAVCKKILRLVPDRPETLVQLGELHLRQKHPGEARAYLHRAADHYVGVKAFDRARDVFQVLVAAEPGNPAHRVRLAETRAAAGDGEGAGEELLALATTMDGAPKSDLEPILRRACELLPGRHEAVTAMVAFLAADERTDDAIAFLEGRLREVGPSPELFGEQAALYAEAGRDDDALRILAECDLSAVAGDALDRFFRVRVERGTAEEAWQKLDEPFGAWEKRSPASLIAALDRLASLADPAHTPALQRLADIHERAGDRDEAVSVLEQLVRVYRQKDGKGKKRALSEAVDRLRALAPTSHVLDSGEAPASAAAAPVGSPTATPPEDSTGAGERAEPAPARPSTDIPIEAEAPAVPLSRADEEFVSGRITQAEILEKYGLLDRSLEQLQEIVSRFPGHVEAQDRRVRLLDERGRSEELRDALVGLALAQRAAGETDEARRSTARAMRGSGLPDETVRVLESLELVERGDASPTRDSPTPDPEPPTVEAQAESAGVEASPIPAEDPQAPQEKPADEVVIDFEDGFDDVDAAPPQAESDGASDDSSAIGDDLSALTAALDSELFLSDPPEDAPGPEAGDEQSIDEVFAAFREQVEQEVDADDHRTHYDLAIAYKEMGLLDEAVAEFEVARGSDELRCEACTMIGVIRREQGRHDEAAEAYRAAIDAVADGGAESLRYDLAETLAEAGDHAAALEAYRALSEADPAFRDVADRIAELESR